MRNKKTALTLVEIMVATAIFSTMMVFAYQGYIMSLRTWQNSSGQISTQSSVRNLSIRIIRDIRESGSSINNFDITNTGTFSIGNNNYNLQSATTGAITRNNVVIAQNIRRVAMQNDDELYDITIVGFDDTLHTKKPIYNVNFKVRRRND